MSSTEQANSVLQIAHLLTTASKALRCNDYRTCKAHLKSALNIYKSDKTNDNYKKASSLFNCNQNHYFHLFYLYGKYCYSVSNSTYHRKAIKSYKKSLKFVHLDLQSTLHTNCNKIYQELSLCCFENNEYNQSLRYCKNIHHDMLNEKQKYDHLLFILELYFILEDKVKIESIIKRLHQWKQDHSVDIRYYTVNIRYYALCAVNGSKPDYHWTQWSVCRPNKWFMKGIELLDGGDMNSKNANDFLAWARYIHRDPPSALDIAFDPNRSISSIYAQIYIIKAQIEKLPYSKQVAESLYFDNQRLLRPRINGCIDVPFCMFYFGILLIKAMYFYAGQKYILKACAIAPELPVVKEKGNQWKRIIIDIKSTCRWCHNISYQRKPYMKCRKCRNVYYCSKYCQKRAWNSVHRYNCQDNTHIATALSVGYYKQQM